MKKLNSFAKGQVAIRSSVPAKRPTSEQSEGKGDANQNISYLLERLGKERKRQEARNKTKAYHRHAAGVCIRDVRYRAPCICPGSVSNHRCRKQKKLQREDDQQDDGAYAQA
ncbi:MAG: hypothetical protein WB561_19980 [Terracidiphilus sp.]